MDYSEWEPYWERLEDMSIFRKEAADYVARLDKHLPLSKEWVILDFGCGFGYVSDELAGKVKEIRMWDYSRNMRNRAAQNAGQHKNVSLIDVEKSIDFPLDQSFDLILVNSVVQYMSQIELSEWLGRWQAVLCKNGCVIISDIIPPGLNPILDMASMIPFSAQQGIIIQALKEGLKEIKKYGKMRFTQPLQQYSRKELETKAGERGYRATFFTRNLTYRPRRLSVALKKI